LLQWGDRVPPDKPLNLTARDAELLRALWAYNFLSTDQIHRLWWADAGLRRAQRRLGWLFHTGYVERFRPKTLRGSFPWTYMLAGPGHELLVSAGLIRPARFRAREVFDFSTVVHDLEVNDWAIAFQRLAGERLLEWRGPREATIEVPGGKRRDPLVDDHVHDLALNHPRPVVPDAGLVLWHQDEPLLLLVELDRTRRPDKNHRKFLRYDALISWWWKHSDLRDTYAQPPLVVFVCQDDAHLESFVAAADTALTGRRAGYGQDAYPARERICFALADDLGAGTGRVMLPPAEPPKRRRDEAGSEVREPRRVILPGLG